MMEHTFTQAIAVGDYLVPDGWPSGIGGLLLAGDPPCDASHRGCSFRVQGTYNNYPVNLIITGRRMNYTKYRHPAIRVKIEWIKDGEPSDYSHGWLMFNS